MKVEIVEIKDGDALLLSSRNGDIGALHVGRHLSELGKTFGLKIYVAVFVEEAELRILRPAISEEMRAEAVQRIREEAAAASDTSAD